MVPPSGDTASRRGWGAYVVPENIVRLPRSEMFLDGRNDFAQDLKNSTGKPRLTRIERKEHVVSGARGRDPHMKREALASEEVFFARSGMRARIADRHHR